MQSGLAEATIKDLIRASLERGPRRYHITRLYMYRALKDSFAPHDSAEKTCLSISHSVDLCKLLGLQHCRIVEANHPEHDFRALRQDSESVDFCVSDQVLEHVEGSPFTAFRESARVLRPGGFICHTTCFINPIHAAPKDFWRFTPDALRLLAEDAGCRVVEVNGWGNREAWALVDLGFRFDAIPEEETNPVFKIAMRNDPECPIVTWVIAQKP
jgi:SAM-dependent methyltransferase